MIPVANNSVLAKDTEQYSLKEQIIRLEIKMEEGFKKIDQSFKAINQRIDDLESNVNRWIDDLRGLIYVILTGIIALIGFVLWDRRTALAPAVKKNTELEEEEEKIKNALRDYALKEPELATALKGVGLM
jgi:predicted NBD/HSP70 family sugar kinase